MGTGYVELGLAVVAIGATMVSLFAYVVKKVLVNSQQVANDFIDYLKKKDTDWREVLEQNTAMVREMNQLLKIYLNRKGEN